MSSQTKLTDHTPDTPQQPGGTDIPLHETVYADLEDAKDTYPADAWYVAIVRDNEQVHRMHEFTDRILETLAPPTELTNAFKSKKSDLSLRDVLPADKAYTQAWETTNFESRYREYLRCHQSPSQDTCDCPADPDEPTSVHDHLRLILEMLDHRPVVLVDVKPPNRPAPRLVLRDFIAEQYERYTDS